MIRRPPALDLAAGVVVLVLLVAQRLGEGVDAPLALTLLLSSVVAGSSAWARTAPLTAYAVGSAALAGEALLVSPGALTPFVNLLGIYLLGLHATRGRALLGPVILLPGVAAYFADAKQRATGIPFGVVAVWMLAWAVAYAAARRAEERESTRQRMRDQAVTDERARIARELHDLVGHTLTVMVVQAGAGRVVLDADVEQARELLATIETTGREAMDELDRVLGALEEREDGQSGLADLPLLAQRLAGAGVAVSLEIDPRTAQLPRSLDHSAYRIVQEALTNALSHGRASAATVRIERAERELKVEVVDDGSGSGSYVPGRGLLGVAERATVLGGAAEHGPVRTGGFRVAASIPLP